MIGNFFAVTRAKLDELMREPGALPDFLDATIEDQDELGGDFLDIDKSWHGIHFLLTGSAKEGDAPLSWVIFAPLALGDDAGCGPARLLAPEQVDELSKALAPITPDKVKKKCNWQAMNDAEIYPQNWRDGDEDYLGENFASLKRFYESAARRHMSVIQWFSE